LRGSLNQEKLVGIGYNITDEVCVGMTFGTLIIAAFYFICIHLQAIFPLTESRYPKCDVSL
jgi:hypothetical protein